MTFSIDAIENSNHTSLKQDIEITDDSYTSLEKTLIDQQQPLAARFRALFTLKALKSTRAVEIIAKAFDDPSALLKHELAYVLGQMKSPHAIPYLKMVLEDKTQEAMVRHEAAEAMGAIGHDSALHILESYLNDESRAVRETCEIAIDRIRFELSKPDHVGKSDTASPFASIDPAPALIEEETSIERLKQILMDESIPLFKRYRAMFALRNMGTEESVLALTEGFQDSSALFRHEIAFVFGQLQHPASVPSLIQVLSNPKEEAMVRHEAAEALGSIATPECQNVLRQFVKDEERVVRESCLVGLDMFEHETSGEFQYTQPVTLV